MVDATPITLAAPHFDQAAAAPGEASKREHFTDGWKICGGQLRRFARRTLNGDSGDLLDDTMTLIAQKLWRSVQTGYTPKHGYVAVLPGLPARAAARVLERTEKHRNNRAISIDYQLTGRDGETLAEAIPVDDDAISSVEDTLENDDLRRRLDRAATRARILGHPLAGELLRSGLGHTNAATAQHHDVTEQRIAATLVWIQREHYALLTASDDRFTQYADELRELSRPRAPHWCAIETDPTGEQMCLFSVSA